MFNDVRHIRNKGRKIATSKSIVNTLYFITSENADRIDLGKGSIVSGKRNLFRKKQNTGIRRFFNFFRSSIF